MAQTAPTTTTPAAQQAPQLTVVQQYAALRAQVEAQVSAAALLCDKLTAQVASATTAHTGACAALASAKALADVQTALADATAAHGKLLADYGIAPPPQAASVATTTTTKGANPTFETLWALLPVRGGAPTSTQALQKLTGRTGQGQGQGIRNTLNAHVGTGSSQVTRHDVGSAHYWTR